MQLEAADLHHMLGKAAVAEVCNMQQMTALHSSVQLHTQVGI